MEEKNLKELIYKGIYQDVANGICDQMISSQRVKLQISTGLVSRRLEMQWSSYVKTKY